MNGVTGRVKNSVAVVVVVVGLFGVIAPAAHAASTTSPKQWASSVCSDVHTWITSSKAALKNLKSAGSLALAASQASTAIDAATSELVSSLQALGRPSSSDGAKAQSAVQKLSSTLQSDSANLKQELANPPTDPVGIAATFAQIGVDATTAANQIKSTATTLKGLTPNGQLQKAFKSSSSCQSLKQAL